MAKSNRIEIQGTDLEAELDRSDGIVSIYLGSERLAHGEGVRRALQLARSALATRFNALAGADADELHGRIWRATQRTSNPPNLAENTPTEAPANVA